MQLKLIFLILLSTSALTLSSCALKSKNLCNVKNSFATGLKQGQMGSSNLSKELFKSCNKKTKALQSYLQGYNLGLNTFCTKERGKSQAEYGLPKETVCRESSEYSKGYFKKLNEICNNELALNDARSFLNTSNQLCKKIKAYSKTYTLELKRQCSYAHGRKFGLNRKNRENLCIDAPTLKSFAKGYNSGLSSSYKKENNQLLKQVSDLRLQRNKIKIKLKTDLSKEQAISLRIELNKIESQILKLRSNVESNKKYIL